MSPAAETIARTEMRDFYEVLGTGPGADQAELRQAFRDAVLRHHPDRSPADSLATRRTAMLNLAWNALRDPIRREAYDRELDGGRGQRLEWPLAPGELPRARPRAPAAAGRRGAVRGAPVAPSRWHDPHTRSVHGFRIPAEVFLAGPAAQEAWIVANHIEGADWRAHRERYWLRFAARHYRERGRNDDWLGTVERLVEIDGSFDTLVKADLREAYTSAGELLRGVGFLRRLEERPDTTEPERRWLSRELRALLADFRDRRVRRGNPQDRAEAAELLLNYLEALDMAPGAADVRAAISAHRRAGHLGRAAELVERGVGERPADGAGWYTHVQLLTEVGQLDRASRLLAEIARGVHPEALDRRRLRADPGRRLQAARRRLERARRRARAVHRPVADAPAADAPARRAAHG